jgi:hypothetical protein
MLELKMDEVIEILALKIGYAATYNGVEAKGPCPTSAINNAKRKWELIQEIETKEVKNSDESSTKG